MNIHIAVCANCDLCVISFRLDTAAMPTAISNMINSKGFGTMKDMSIVDTMWANNAVRESKNTRIMMVSSANGMT